MNISTVGDLLELLRDVPEDTPLRVAYQPHYPLMSQSVVTAYIDPDNDPEWEEDERAFYVGAGDGSDYLPGAAAYELGWR